ncbi:sialate O-acetylesterase [Paenibacillus sp.]|uniref:sialate O-acetylesterase n=1 Tax=Paenibacillus sp. TaxID=58172 RepID=UPI002D509E93|nr:sialate O-acetylesterase [Paenibacillus sp.]HZG87979.1 sialate O-acetylesterase [Paenibacillus sp.]
MNSFRLANIFSDHMVLQRDKPIKIWGESADNQTIFVKINFTEVTAEVKDGKWAVELPPMAACESCELRVSSSNPVDQEIIVHNVAIGEVWVAGGQSNMEFDLKSDIESDESIRLADNPFIRFYDCPKTSYEGHEHEEDFSEFGFWRPCDAKHAPYFSAVGFYFAKKIYELQQVPVGIIGCTWGGSSASAWMDEKYLAEDQQLSVYLHEYEEAVKDLDIEEYELKLRQRQSRMNSPEVMAFIENMRAGRLTAEQLSELAALRSQGQTLPPIGPKYFNRPAGLYHHMVEKISGFTARGIIWYQGESDEKKAELYGKLFTALIQCWREAWQDELPFLFVQLAPYGSWAGATGENFPAVREQQELVSKTVPNAYMASIMDAGMEFDIHPKRKRPVGERLALLARNKVYGENLISEAPEVERASRDAGTITITFKNVGNGFVLIGEQINGIKVFIDNEELVEFKSEAKNNTLTIESERMQDSEKIEVKFAWTAYVEVNLYSSAGLPLKPFKLIL